MAVAAGAVVTKDVSFIELLNRNSQAFPREDYILSGDHIRKTLR